jgi:hypothetical protein
MAIKIPSGVTPPRDQRLDIIRIIGAIYDKVTNAKGGLKDQVKEKLVEKEATFVQSDLCIGQLRPGPTFGPIDPKKFYAKFKAGEITEKDFLSAISVGKEACKVFLPQRAIEKMCDEIEDPPKALTIEFREDVEFDAEQVSEAIVATIRPMLLSGEVPEALKQEA